MKVRLYKCAHCGQIVAVLKETGVPVICCGEPMKELRVGETDGAVEKHLPVYEVKDGILAVNVGSVEHPMLDAHYIEWVAVVTKNGVLMKKDLAPAEAPKASFALLPGDEVEAVYAYCNLHGLWKA